MSTTGLKINNKRRSVLTDKLRLDACARASRRKKHDFEGNVRRVCAVSTNRVINSFFTRVRHGVHAAVRGTIPSRFGKSIFVIQFTAKNGCKPSRLRSRLLGSCYARIEPVTRRKNNNKNIIIIIRYTYLKSNITI